MENPLFSVIVLTYNSEDFILDTLKSVCRQNFNNYEVLVIDDCSSDNTWDICQNFHSHVLTIYRNDKNIGEYPNRNNALLKAKGKYVIYIDGEDLLYDNALNILSNYVQDFPDVAQHIAVEWDERVILPLLTTPDNFEKMQYLDRGYTALNFTRIIFDRKKLVDIGGFDFEGIKAGDYYIQLVVGKSFNSLFIPAGFSWWRRRKGQASSLLLKNNYNFFKEILKFKPQLIANSSTLNETEKKIAYSNLYGMMLRYVFKNMFTKNILLSIKFILNFHIPANHLWSAVKRPKYVYFDNYNGENPLKSNL